MRFRWEIKIERAINDRGSSPPLSLSLSNEHCHLGTFQGTDRLFGSSAWIGARLAASARTCGTRVIRGGETNENLPRGTVGPW